MGLFSKILEKIGIKKKAETTAKPVQTSKPVQAPKPVTTSHPKPSSSVKPAVPAGIPPTASAYMQNLGQTAKPEAVEMVDVVSNLEKMAASNPRKLDWKVSIVDLLTLLDIDSSFEARKELAEELDCPPEMMSDSARMNTWLHKTVLQKIAENGGNVPQELLD
ncbi:MAG: DUF3597 domain-containing protein [Anaerolineales bacterium]|jgi:hypothetical protein|nr:DUF3597 domain-containing protein [Anaerolineales bacterium]